MLLHEAGPGVIAETLPLQPHLIQEAAAQLQAGNTAIQRVRERYQLGLLRHHLGDPDAVGIELVIGIRPTPIRFEHPGLLRGIPPSMGLPPGQQAMPQGPSSARQRLVHHCSATNAGPSVDQSKQEWLNHGSEPKLG